MLKIIGKTFFCHIISFQADKYILDCLNTFFRGVDSLDLPLKGIGGMGAIFYTHITSLKIESLLLFLLNNILIWQFQINRWVYGDNRYSDF